MTGEIYRYSVRSDRDRFHAIGRAAKAAGVSVEAFVQSHFETILDAQPALDMKPKPTPASLMQFTLEDAAAARDAGMRPAEWRVLKSLARHADDEGVASPGAAAIVRDTGLASGSIPVLFTRLAAAGHITRLKGGGYRGAAIYRVAPQHREARS